MKNHKIHKEIHYSTSAAPWKFHKNTKLNRGMGIAFNIYLLFTFFIADFSRNHIKNKITNDLDTLADTEG